MHDIFSGLKVVQAIANAAIDADNTPAAVDRRGYESAMLVLHIGAGGITFSSTNKIEFVLTHSDDNVSYSNVTDDDVLGKSGISSGIIKALTAAHAASAVYRFGYRGNKRYLKLLADFSGTHGAATPLAAVWVFGHGPVTPEAAQA